MIDRDRAMAALTAARWNVTQAAGQLGMHPNTLTYQLRRIGIARPAPPAAPVECHPQVAALLQRLDAVRTQGRLIRRTYLPGPERAAMLRRLEAEQLSLREAIRGQLGEGEARQGIVRGTPAPGAIRPAWDAATTWAW